MDKYAKNILMIYGIMSRYENMVYLLFGGG